jgi:LacI family transcriptional regulator, repressor for deo operon, udp, cdd, tsx, nupC, and nupG
VFCMSDEMAMGAIKAVRDHGLRVPEDISVVGFDGHELAEVMELTTISQPVVNCGRRAGEFLLQTIIGSASSRRSGSATGAVVPHEVMPTELIARRTSAPLRGKVNG